jgi:hypothetical protein
MLRIFYPSFTHRNENVELVPNVFEPHCGCSPKNTQVGTFAQWFYLMNIFLELFDTT